MKKIDNTEKWNDREWAGAAAWLSGEENGSGEDARILAGEEEDIMKKWNDLKYPETEPVDVDKFKVAVLALISLLYDGITDADQWNTVLYKYLHNYIPL